MFAEISGLIYKWQDLKFWQEFMTLAKLRNVKGYKNKSRQQLQSIFTTPPSPKPTPKL